MQSRAGGGGEGAEKLARQIGIEAADCFARPAGVKKKPAASGKIDDGARQRFVQRRVSEAEAGDPGLVAERARERLPENDAAILDRVMGVDGEIAARFEGQIDFAVAGDLVEQVIEKRDAGVDFGAPPRHRGRGRFRFWFRAFGGRFSPCAARVWRAGAIG